MSDLTKILTFARLARLVKIHFFDFRAAGQGAAHQWPST
jgi:hypothetical protein